MIRIGDRNDMVQQGLPAEPARISTIYHSLMGEKNSRVRLQKICDVIAASRDVACCRIWTIQAADMCDKGCPHGSAGLCRCAESCLHLLVSSDPDDFFQEFQKRLPYGRRPGGRFAGGMEGDCLVHDAECGDERANEQSSGVFAGYELHDNSGRVHGVLAVFADHPITTTAHETFADLAAFAAQVMQAAHLESKLALEVTERKRLEKNLGYVYEVLAEKVVSSRRYAEKTGPEARRAQKMEAVALMAGGVAHDLNNILSGLVSYPDLLLKQLSLDSSLQRGLEFIRESGMRAAAMVADLLTVSRNAAAPREVGQLNQLIAQHLDSAAHQKIAAAHPRISIETQFDPHLLAIKCSSSHLTSIIKNLLLNAVDALDGTGRVLIATANKHLDRSLRGYDEIPPGEYAVLTVADNGKGILPADLDRIFEPFYTKKIMNRRGNGLGLTVVWNAVHDHGGAINVVSSAHGTRFDIYFPVTREKTGGQTQSHEIARLHGQGETILIVDDEPAQRDIISQMLAHLNYRVTAAASGEEALACLEKQAFDLAVLDMVMDPGLNGRETFERMRAIRPAQRAIIASGYAEDIEIKKAQKLGAGAFVRKPYTVLQLGEAVQQTLHRGAES